MSDSLFQISGISSGIPWDEMIAKTIEAASKPKTQWQNRIDTLEVKKTLYQQLQSQLNKLRTAMTSLRLPDAYKKKTAEFTVLDPAGVNADGLISAKVGADAVFTSWDINIEKLARAQRHVSSRFDDAGESLGISGSFRIHMGSSYSVINIASADSLREINQKIAKATDQYGNKMNVSAKLLDNRLVIESLVAGKGNTGTKLGEKMVMVGDAGKVETSPGSGKYNYEMYLPRPSVRDEATGKYIYPHQLLEVTYESKNVDGSSYYYRYKAGTDFEYDSANGVITWLAGGQRPPEGAEFSMVYRRDDIAMKRDTTLIDSSKSESEYWDVLPALPTGVSYRDSGLVIIAGGKEYKQGTDFEVIEYVYKDPATNITTNQCINWLRPSDPDATSPNPPTASTYYLQVGTDVDYSTDENAFYIVPNNSVGVTRDTTDPPNPNGDLLPASSSGAKYPSSGLTITAGGNEYTQESDFDIVEDSSGNQYVKWRVGVTPPDVAYYHLNSDGYSDGSVLAQLGFITPPGVGSTEWDYAEGSVRDAEDAKFSVDGVEMTRSSNTIDDVIANVTFELKGQGNVRMNITQDVTATIEALESFVEEYNAVMEWINYYVSQKEDAANPVEEDDHLSSILSDSKGNTVFGVLHGDQLLWSIKNQLREKISSPLSVLSGSVASKKVQHPSESLNVKGSFYVYVGGKATRIDVDSGDSMADIQQKLELATNIFSPSDPSKPQGGSMGLTATISNGQLVIGGPGSVSFNASNQATIDTEKGMIKRAAGQDYDLLSFVPVTASPIEGSLTIYTGAYQFDAEGNMTQEPVIYVEGRDYRVVTETNSNGVMQSKIEWMQGGKSPSANSSYSYTYNYWASSVMISEIQGSGGIGDDTYDISWLDFRADSGKAMLANFGFTTEAASYGKSGYIEFDSEAFFSKVQEDSNIVSNVMLTFMRGLDAYIGNLVDSSSIVVAGQTVTKGRIAGALNTIDSEQDTLNKRIAKLEKDLETKQTTLYKQYSNMEVAIQKLNAQMSAITNFVNAMGSGSSSSSS
jgi:flagellar capping protein FliD